MLVEWFSIHGDQFAEDTGLWIVTLDFTPSGDSLRGVVSFNSVVCGAHLILVYGSQFLPSRFDPDYTLDAFVAYFVNKFADHHSHTLAYWYFMLLLTKLPTCNTTTEWKWTYIWLWRLLTFMWGFDILWSLTSETFWLPMDFRHKQPCLE